MFDLENTKYEVHYTNLFKKQYKKILKQGKDKNYRECHITTIGYLYINITIKNLYYF